MTVQNDFNTLINAIIDNLEEMGVTNVSFESETGIMGLIDRILEIETGSSIEVPTVIDCVMTLPGPNTIITVGDSYTCSGALRGSYNNFSFKIGGATIYAYNHDDLLGQAVTNSDGNFTINGMYHKATSSVSYSLKFLATDIFLSSTLTGSATRPVSKKSITLPQSINDTWVLTPGDYSVNIGSQYQGAPITLMVDSQAYDMEYVDEYGFITFDISNLTGVNECQLVVETNDIFSNAQSNNFNISIGVNIYINPELQVTSDKDILSYADNESATLTAKIKSDNAAEISSINIPLTYREDPVLTTTKSGITITEQNGLYLCESINTDGYIIFDMDAEQTETSFTISNVTANSVDSDAKCMLVQYSHGEGTVTYSWELLDTNNFGNGDYIIRIKDGNIDVYKDGIHVESQSLSEGYKLGFGIYGYSFDISDINIERIINNGLNTGIYTSRGVGDVAITAKYGTLVSERYAIDDCIGYGDDAKIKSTWAKDTTTISGRTIYTLDTELTDNVECEWKYLNSIPKGVIGFNVYSPSIVRLAMFSVEYSYYAYYTTSSSTSQYLRLDISPTVNDVFKIRIENHTAKWYLNDTLLLTQNLNPNYSLIASIESMNASPIAVNYIKIKPL